MSLFRGTRPLPQRFPKGHDASCPYIPTRPFRTTPSPTRRSPSLRSLKNQLQLRRTRQQLPPLLIAHWVQLGREIECHTVYHGIAEVTPLHKPRLFKSLRNNTPTSIGPRSVQSLPSNHTLEPVTSLRSRKMRPVSSITTQG
jgi:hypothetical protein